MTTIARSAARVAGAPIGLLVCWQVAVILGLAAIGQPLLIGAVVVLLAVSSWRFRGRWGCEWLRLWLSYRLRRRRVREPELLRRAAGVRGVTEVPVDGCAAAVIERLEGSAVVLELSGDGVVPEMLTLPEALLPEQPDVAVQLVMHVRPAARAWRGWAWLAVQVFRDGSSSEAEVRRSLTAAVRKVRRGLGRLGYDAPPLDAQRFSSDLRTVAQLDLCAPEPVAVEHWHHWSTPGLCHGALRVSSWTPAGTPGEPLVAAMLTADGVGTTVTLAARRLPTAPAIALEMAVRVTGRSEAALASAIRDLRRNLAAAGASTERLDGRAARGLAATLPLGGFLTP